MIGRVTGNRIVAGAMLMLAVACFVIAGVGGLAGAIAPLWVLVLVAGAVVLAWVAVRAAKAASLDSVKALLTEFLACVNAGEYEAAHQWLYTATGIRRGPDSLAGEFPDGLVSYDIIRIQITRSLSHRSQVRKVAKAVVRLRTSGGTTTDYLFLLAKENRTWTVDQWLVGGQFDRVDYSPP